MSNSSYRIRNYRPADFDAYVKLNVEAEELDPIGRCTSLQALRDTLRQPNFTPEKDMFIVEIDGRVIGYMSLIPERSARRAILDCLVHPERRKQGLARKLLSCALGRARKLRANVVHVNVTENNSAAKAALSKSGFSVVRRFLELRVELADFPESLQDASLCRHLQPGEERRLAQLQNRCFAGTWGYNPNTTRDIVTRLSLSCCSPDDIILVCDGDRPIGYSWIMIDCPAETPDDKSRGRIYMLGVDPAYRGRGIGRTALLAGLSHLKARSIQIVELTVDSENSTACALYASAGFKIRARSLWYEQAVV